MSDKKKFNTGWLFCKQPFDRTYDSMTDTKSNWAPIDLPHDWLIYQTKNLYESCEGWYQKDFFYIEDSQTLLFLCFDGIYMDSTLFVNGQEAGEWKYGYTSFEFEITPFLKTGKNNIRVRVRHQAPNSRWYTGAGIYRNVWLKRTPVQHFVTDGIYISTSTNDCKTWNLQISDEVVSNKPYTVHHQLLDSSNRVIVENLKANSIIENPQLWSLKKPALYHLYSELIIEGVVVDSITNTFGFRKITLDSEHGFFLNDQHIKLNGVCQHHDLGALGTAINTTAMRRQLEILQTMGCNAIRISHNMPAPELLELADSMGILMIDEAFDMWERSKTDYDYARFFKEWSSRDIAHWIRRDRNHPCVILWSIGNEIYDTHADAHGQEITEYLYKEVLKHDPNQNAVATMGSNYMPWENAQKCADIIKCIGYNYSEKLYQKHHKEHPDWIIYGSETSSIVQSRGIYHFPLKQPILADDDLQCSSLGNSTTSWGAKSLAFCALTEQNTPFSLGQFLWTGFDYIGEPTPYHTKNSYFGQVDTAGFPKDSYYFYQSVWTNYKTHPMIHIAPYWDFNEGQLIDVRVFSNAPCVELIFNKKSLGKQTSLIGDWQIPYQKGHLHAIAYDENGNTIAEAHEYSFGDSAKICLTADKTTFTHPVDDLIFVTISTEDADCHEVKNANNYMAVSVSGAARLVGLDNGDSTDFDEYKGTCKKLFSGKLLAILAPNMLTGTATITVHSKGLPDATLTLNTDFETSDIENREEFALLSCFETPCPDEIPVRKISLTAKNGQYFDKTHQTLEVEATIYPKNASYQDLEWRVTGDTGVDLNLASLEVDPKHPNCITLTAHGDGDFRLRCSCRNGKEYTPILSQLEFSIQGFGAMNRNPYEFISGSLYDSYEGEVSNGNERGVATSREQKTVITYENLDFGDYGSDTVTIPIFELDSKPTEITFREGGSSTGNGEILGTYIYDKPSKWNVYQEETFHFPRRLKGVTSFTLELEHKIHMKGFSFKKLEKAFETLHATEADHLYGDTFTVCEDSVEGIGNNVSLEYTDLDFKENNGKKTLKLSICGRCPIDKNTIHIRFHGMDEDVNQLAEFLHCDDYEIQTFDLEEIIGVQDVTFIFLPGSNFDFKWFQFEYR